MARPSRRSPALLAALLAVAAAACDDVPNDAIEACSASQVIPGSVATDILFVIDDSGSMAGEQDIVATSLLEFVRELARSTVENDWQIGITTTSVEQFDGSTSFDSGPENGNPLPAGALVKLASGAAGDLVYAPATYPATNGWGDATRILARSPSLTDADVVAYSANFRVGIDGSGKEQPFRAARLALTDRLLDGTNAGFLRPGARLAIIFVSDEDDCTDTEAPFATTNSQCQSDAFKAASLDPVGGFADFLLGPIGGELRDVVVGAIFWPPGAAACGASDNGDRFAALADALGAARVRTGSVCADFSDSLIGFAAAIAPASVPLEGAPADHRLLVVRVIRDGNTIPCTVAAEGSAGQSTADAIYSGPRSGRPAMLTLQNACRLELGDRIDVDVVCVR